MKRKQGVSLIVLSITILVMVILASAAVITLENSGIIGRSKTAVNKQQLQEEMTRLTIIKNGILTDNLGTITVADYVAELDKKGIIDGTTTTDEYGSTVVKTTTGIDVYIKQNGESDLTISFEQIIPPPTLGSLITSAEDYGKTVNYESDNGVTDWKVFYKQTIGDEQYIYLIASEKLAYDKVPSVPEMIITEQEVDLGEGKTKKVGQVSWENSNTVPNDTGTIQQPELWLAEWGNYGSYSSKSAGRCASYFLDETYWEAFKNTTKYKDVKGESYVKGTIGTPTLEMYIASWNAKREAAIINGDTTTYDKELTLKANGSGYDINNTTSVTLSKLDSLYFWSTASYTSVWLAAPCSYNTNYMYIISKESGITNSPNNNPYNGLRPVVCLSADIPATLGTEGTTDFVI